MFKAIKMYVLGAVAAIAIVICKQALGMNCLLSIYDPKVPAALQKELEN